MIKIKTRETEMENDIIMDITEQILNAKPERQQKSLYNVFCDLDKQQQRKILTDMIELVVHKNT